MAQSQTQAPNMDQFEVYFKRADLDQDGRISGSEAVSFFQAANLPRQVLAQIWTIADQNRTGFLGRQEFYNALKLVTVAQSKRELTPDIVKAALYSPASAKIPAPKINLTPSPGTQSNFTAGSAVPPQSATAAVPPQTIGIRASQGLTSQQSQVMRPPRPPLPSATFQSPQVVGGPRMPHHGGIVPVSNPPSSSPSLGENNGVSQAGLSFQSNRSVGPVGQDSFAVAASGLPPSTQPGAQAASVLQPASSKPSDTSVSNLVEVKDSKAVAVASNGYAPDSLFGDVFSAAPIQTKQDSTKVTSGVSSLPVSSAIVPTSMGVQTAVTSSPLDSTNVTAGVSSLPVSSAIVPTSLGAQPPVGSQHHQGQLPVKPNQQFLTQASPALPSGAVNSAGWPRMTQSDIQKYSKVFMQVDTDRDGKITGEQARNLFLSWGLRREVLKQVWDLSDQDNDSMLSLREFCVALYFMERHREGQPLPTVLPSGIMFDETTLPVMNQPVAPQGNTVWRATSAFQQPHSTKPPPGKPPRPVPVPQPDDSVHPSRQKPKVPVLEKHLLDQLSTEEQNALNSKFQEASDAEKKVAELEKEILDAREKIQFYHAKMQELILYKSRCDNRLNEITERVSADKREVELLGKKYEEKYRQAGDVASKLTIEEATFRDIQEKKMELYRVIVKMEQDGGADSIQERANRIQLDLEELVKSLNERCKTYGLRAKPTSLVELPFGWQPGIQGAVADWDENWDKFEDEGFSFVKELTLDVQNVIAPPKPKSSLREKETSVNVNGDDKSSADADGKAEKARSTSNQRPEDDGANAQGEEHSVSSPPESPARTNALESESKEFEDSYSKRDISYDGSPHATQSEHGGTESVFMADKGFDEPGWGTFDTSYDTDAASEFTHVTKDVHSERQSDNLFGSDDWGLNPIRTSTARADNMYPKQSPFFDSVPSTPSYNVGGSPLADSMFQKKSPFGFADSVPSTPMYSSGNSPQKFGDGPEERSFNSSFSRFDSFNMQDGGLFTPREPLPFSRFDSMHSTRDSEYDHGLSASRDSLARFDSFRSMADSDYNFGLFPPRESVARFDSMRSTRDSDFGQGFSSFDDADPFGSNDPFKTSLESQTPRRDSDGWNDHFKTSFESQTPRRDSDGWNDPFKTSFDSQTPRRDSDSWNDPFKTSFDSQTPRRDSDSWNDAFKTSFEGQTPRRDSDSWKAF
ncbi:uncharacterized protein [Coffea arabica]|uniref:Uncharacterized protein n=1 Tax=Coffea arabica TaxID=13443 RepID=A0A6P6TAH0_COFAR|nr:epidermal growth factor receptor substrate 15-like 1 [Coffea arabica]